MRSKGPYIKEDTLNLTGYDLRLAACSFTKEYTFNPSSDLRLRDTVNPKLLH